MRIHIRVYEKPPIGADNKLSSVRTQTSANNTTFHTQLIARFCLLSAPVGGADACSKEV